MYRLTEEEKEDLASLVRSNGFPSLMKVLENGLTDLEDGVLRYALEGGDDRDFLQKKSQLEGADKLFSTFSRLMTKVKKID